MDAPSPDEVARACALWFYLPPTAGRIESAEYLAIRYPLWYEHPLQLVGFLPQRPVAEVLDEVLDRCREVVGHARPEILCWVRLGAPPGLAEALRVRGGTPVETLDVLARSVPPPTDVDPPAGVAARWSDDFEVFRDAARLGTEIFGGDLPDDEALTPLFVEEAEKVVAGGGGSVVAYDEDGTAIGTAGVTLAGPDARLWGAAVLPRARGRGVYRALLAQRLAYAHQHGARLALVKGRVDTSAPILRRAGFAGFGREQSFLLPL